MVNFPWTKWWPYKRERLYCTRDTLEGLRTVALRHLLNWTIGLSKLAAIGGQHQSVDIFFLPNWVAVVMRSPYRLRNEYIHLAVAFATLANSRKSNDQPQDSPRQAFLGRFRQWFLYICSLVKYHSLISCVSTLYTLLKTRVIQSGGQNGRLI